MAYNALDRIQQPLQSSRMVRYSTIPSPFPPTSQFNPAKLNRRSRIFLKLENLQPAGSFKSRGLGHYTSQALSRATHPDRVHFYSSSGGNAGLAVVHAANALGRPSTVVVPLSTKAMMVAKIRAAGAEEVVQFGTTWKEADGFLREVVVRRAEERGEEPVYCPPFDHGDVWEGNATMVEEMREQSTEEEGPSVVVCSVGGGGLFNGIVQGLEKQEAWAQTTVLAVETQGADSLAQSLEKGELVTLPGITSLATSLGATTVSERTFVLASKYRATGRVKTTVLTDAEAAMGCWRFADDERMLVELACGVSVALCYGGRLKRALGRPVRKEEKVVIVVCGGQNVTVAMVEEWRKQFGDLDDGWVNGHAHAQLADVPSDATAPNGVS